MAHDTHHDSHHEVTERTQSTTSFGSAFFFVLILAGLFIAAVNFVNVMGQDEEGGHDGGHATEHATPAHEATSSQTMEGETGVGKPAEHTTGNPGTPTDTAHAAGH